MLMMNVPARRQNGDCPFGGIFYKCVNGFEGCCFQPAEDPCNPGATCPKDKDRTPGRYKTTITTSTSSVKTTLGVLESPHDTSPRTTTTSSISFSSSAVSLSRSAPQPTAYVTVFHQAPSPAADAQAKSSSSFPVGAVVGGVIGALVLIVLSLCFLMFLKRRKPRELYQAPTYPSPFMDFDMSPESQDTSAMKCRRSRSAVQQLDSTEVVAHVGLGIDLSTRFAELPAEPVK